ncbi:hypothetical protein M9H77_09222 [Catharanthus roseus]|uniref:Uncharacterized protein n=1 Tax=Catharanthus roseus TaxID=4058 RepID=A0ACC0C069_CATRO|nr:hypothetical protein M9H77_09222 [Catharanthus roseus]
MDIPIGQEIYTIYGYQKAAQECYFGTVQEVEREEESIDAKLIVLGQLKPEQTVRVGREFPVDLRIKLFYKKPTNSWTLNTDGSTGEHTEGAAFILEDLDRHQYTYAMKFLFPVSNNEAKYEAFLCVNEEEGRHILREIHEDICDSHIRSRALVTKAMSFVYILINMLGGLYCAWLVPLGWARRGSPAKVVQGGLYALGFRMVLTTDDPFKVPDSVC